MYSEIIIASTGIVVGVVAGYYSDAAAVKQRLAVVETQQKNDVERLERIEDKVDRVLEHVIKQGRR